MCSAHVEMDSSSILGGKLAVEHPHVLMTLMRAAYESCMAVPT